MKISELKPGMYEIAVDVVNPKADRRKSSRDFSAHPTWSKGVRVVVTEGLYGELRIHPPTTYSHLGVSGYLMPGGDRDHPGFSALAAALRPVKQTHREWVTVEIQCPDRLLVKLLEAGKISRQDILDAKRKDDSDD